MPESDIAFDKVAEQIFASIPQEVRDAHRDELVFIYPFPDASQEPLYVFGESLQEILRKADTRFGPQSRGELMSLATDDGSVPEEILAGMRGLY